MNSMRDYWERHPHIQEQIHHDLKEAEQRQGGIPVLPQTSTLEAIFGEEVAGQAVWSSALFTIIVTWDDFSGYLTATVLTMGKAYNHTIEQRPMALAEIEDFLVEYTPYTEQDKGSWVPFPRHYVKGSESDRAFAFYDEFMRGKETSKG